MKALIAEMKALIAEMKALTKPFPLRSSLYLIERASESKRK
jgi:hypothetical protein